MNNGIILDSKFYNITYVFYSIVSSNFEIGSFSNYSIRKKSFKGKQLGKLNIEFTYVLLISR